MGWTELRGGKRHLLAVFLLPNCSLSEYSAELVSDLHEQYGDSVAFVGLAFGTAPVADQMQAGSRRSGFRSWAFAPSPIPLPARSSSTPSARPTAPTRGVYGGTIILLNDRERNARSASLRET